MNAPIPDDDTLHVPRWLLAFVLPTIGLIVAASRMEYRSNENAMETRAVEARLQQAEQRVGLLERQVQWLCAQRARDDYESNRTGAGVCP